MRLGDLVAGLEGEAAQKIVTAFAIDHRKIAPGTIFGAFKGERFNGEDFIDEAVASGAIAIVAGSSAIVKGAVHIAAAEPRQEFANIAARFFRPMPANVAAVTGTNGKTSCVELTRQLWRMAGYNAASVGTLGITTDGEQIKTGLTTPDIVTFLSNLSGLAKEGVSHVAFEASSHGLSQYRCEGVPVKIAAFTNLSRDHLDYHGDMDSYFEAKMRLFDEVVGSDGIGDIWAVIWADDAWSDKVVERARTRGLKIITAGRKGAEIKLLNRIPTQLGQKLELEILGVTVNVELPLIGEYQAFNALTSAGIVIASGAKPVEVAAHMARLQPVRGRMECAVITKAGAPVYVDYAHTPDALAAAIGAMRPHKKGKLITVFGAGGDRDRGKRAEMGKIAIEQSDIAIVTDDNPRNEDPSAIRAEILAGAAGATEIADRREAIAYAIGLAGAEDIVLIAGKGHEQGQIIGDKILPFDDVEVARECAA
jgi:UDP-N-acetylmuramoyl-L-alanyl-D-glutamate--2,6-diaminopimelate ligase